MLHHNNKGKDEYAGSASIAGVADAMRNIRRADESKVASLQIKTREDELEPFQITQTDTGLACALRWRVMIAH